MTLKLIKNGKHQHWKLHTKLTFSSRDVIREEKRFSCLNFYYYTFVFYKQSIFDHRPENCLSFSKNSPQKIV